MSTVKGEIKRSREPKWKRDRQKRRVAAPSAVGVKVIPVSKDYLRNYDQIRWGRTIPGLAEATKALAENPAQYAEDPT
jgi:hypothetical protein